MKLLPLLRADLKFLWRYGFGALYLLFTALYLFILAAIPAGVRETARVFLIFTDPAAMGLFFMGALLLLEKSQRVLPALAVSPVPPWAYVCSKSLALSLVGTLVGGVLSLGAPVGLLLPRLFALLLGALFFSLIGMVAAFFARSLNEFILLSVVAEGLFFFPGVLALLGVLPDWLFFLPGVLIAAGLQGSLLATPLLLPWVAAAFFAAERTARAKMTELGGVKL